MSLVHARAVWSRVLVALSCAIALDCAAPRSDRFPESPANLSQPEPDPECWGTVRDRLAVHGIQEVTVRVGVDSTGKVDLIRFLSPELTAAQERDLRRACESCTWKPGLAYGGAPAERSTGTFTISTRKKQP